MDRDTIYIKYTLSLCQMALRRGFTMLGQLRKNLDLLIRTRQMQAQPLASGTEAACAFAKVMRRVGDRPDNFYLVTLKKELESMANP